jgi:hypothetical protein
LHPRIRRWNRRWPGARLYHHHFDDLTAVGSRRGFFIVEYDMSAADG